MYKAFLNFVSYKKILIKFSNNNQNLAGKKTEINALKDTINNDIKIKIEEIIYSFKCSLVNFSIVIPEASCL